MRVRWKVAARAAAVLVGGVLALRALPELLRAPQPPPVAADVGLLGVGGKRERLAPSSPPSGRKAPRAPLPPGVISSVPGRRQVPAPPPPKPPPPAPSTPAPPLSEPPPAAAPSPPPNDGSEEFAPR